MMKNHILIMLVLGLVSLLCAQVSNYTFAEGTDTYTPLDNYSVSLAAGDNANEILSLPFTFTYDNTAYNSLCVVTNGFVRLGTTSTTSFSNTLSATASTRLNVIAPLWDDLYDDATSEIRYGTTGSEPNRVFVIEWNAVLWNTSIGTPQHFQLHLYETTNIIRFSYNLQEPGGYASATIGINAAPGGSGNYLSVSPGNPSLTSSSSSNNSINSINNLPPGKWFQFSPPNPYAPPAAAILVGPTHESTDNLEHTALRWQPGSANTAGYKIYIGTNQPLNYIADLGDATTYNHSELFAFDTTYYWQVIPYNAINVEAVDCPVWSFSVRPDATVQTFPISWDFGTSFSDPFPPTNWSKHSGPLNDPTILGTNGSGAWSQYMWCNNYEGANVAAGTDIYGQDTSWLITPPISVTVNDLEITFDIAYMAAGTQSLPAESGGLDDKFAVLIGDGISWTQADVARLWDNQGSTNVLDQISPSGMRVSIPLGAPGTKYIAFYTESSEWNVSNSLMIDNVTISNSDLNLDVPEVIISLDGDEISLEWNVINGANSYLIYTTSDPSEEESWILETVTANPYYTFSEDQESKFYRVVASTEIF